MADQKDARAVVFVSRSGLQFFSTGAKTVASLNFDPALIKDFDVTDSKKFNTALVTFIDQNKLPPSPVIFLFAEATCYYYDYKETDPVKVKVLAQDFVNVVPFETLLTKIYKTKDGTRIVSINEKIYREVALAFESKGFVSLGVIPSFILTGKYALATALDPDMGRQILFNIESLRLQSLAASGHEGSEGVVEEKGPQKPVVEGGFKITRNAILLAIFFLGALGVLIFLLVRQ